MPDTLPPVACQPVRWEPDRSVKAVPWPQPSMPVSIGRGMAGRCPACGGDNLFAGFSTVRSECRVCAAPLGRVPADDAPQYFNIILVAHVVIGLMLLVEQLWAPALWVYATVFLPGALLMSLGLLRPVKGATIGLLLHLGMVRDEEADSRGSPSRTAVASPALSIRCEPSA